MLKTGTDFAGPITLKKGHTRKPVYVKGYICLFVWFSTRAVHLELVADLSTDAFLAAFRRFVARRGCPCELFSDNGSNYVGANHESTRLYEMLSEESNHKLLCHFFFFTNCKIRWSFMPGKAPHFGGLWEAAVKAAKATLRKVIGNYPLSVEECATVLTDAEATLNSRPLCQMDTQPEDGVDALTPGHFLVGKPLRAVPQHATEYSSVTGLKRWNLCKKMCAEFWERWSREYLQALQARHKWSRNCRNLRVGEVVLLKDLEVFMRTRPLAIIQQTHPGPDGRVRAVTVRASKGVYRRPIVKIVPLLSTNEVSSRPGEDVQA